MKKIESLAQAECSALLDDTAFIRSIAAVAMHTRDTNFEGGFLLTRNRGIKLGKLILSGTVEESGAKGRTDSVLFPDDTQSVASFHTHPVRKFGEGDKKYILTMDEFPSDLDLYHMRHHQRVCDAFTLGLLRKDMTDPDSDKIVLDLYRSTQPLPQNNAKLLGEYGWAINGNFKERVEESLGIKSVRLGFDLIASDALPNKSWGDHQRQIAKLYV